jgi:hypothetical protein
MFVPMVVNASTKLILSTDYLWVSTWTASIDMALLIRTSKRIPVHSMLLFQDYPVMCGTQKGEQVCNEFLDTVCVKEMT